MGETGEIAEKVAGHLLGTCLTLSEGLEAAEAD